MLVPSLFVYADHSRQVVERYSCRSLPSWGVVYDILRGQPSAKGAKVLCLER